MTVLAANVSATRQSTSVHWEVGSRLLRRERVFVLTDFVAPRKDRLRRYERFQSRAAEYRKEQSVHAGQASKRKGRQV